MEKVPFEVLEQQKKLLEKEYDEPVFIDIKQSKLYIIKENGEKEYVF